MLVAVDEESYSKEGYKFFEEDILDSKVDDDNSSDGKDPVSFQEIATNMLDITPDGGVKKQTVVHGIGEVIPTDSNVTSTLVL